MQRVWTSALWRRTFALSDAWNRYQSSPSLHTCSPVEKQTSLHPVYNIQSSRREEQRLHTREETLDVSWRTLNQWVFIDWTSDFTGRRRLPEEDVPLGKDDFPDPNLSHPTLPTKSSFFFFTKWQIWWKNWLYTNTLHANYCTHLVLYLIYFCYQRLYSSYVSLFKIPSSTPSWIITTTAAVWKNKRSSVWNRKTPDPWGCF